MCARYLVPVVSSLKATSAQLLDLLANIALSNSLALLTSMAKTSLPFPNAVVNVMRSLGFAVIGLVEACRSSED